MSTLRSRRSRIAQLQEATKEKKVLHYEDEEQVKELLFTEHPFETDYANAELLMTSKNSAQKITHKWFSTQVRGTLQLVEVRYTNVGDFEVTIPPVVRLVIVDECYDTKFLYELPLNFKFESSGRLVAV